MITNPREQAFLMALVADLDAAGTVPILLRNHERFPEEIGNDLDIWVRPSMRSDARSVFCTTSAQHGFRLIHEHRRYAFMALWVAHESDPSRIMHIDIYGGALRWHGHPFLCEAEFENAATMRDGVRIPAPLHEAWTLAATSLAWGGFFKERYRVRINALAEASALTAFAAGTLGGMSDELTHRLAGRIGTAADRGLAHRIRIKSRSRHLQLDPLGAAVALASHWWWEIRCHLLKPPGLIVGVSDGAHADLLQRLIQNGLPVFGGVQIIRQAWTWATRLHARKLAGDNHLVIVCASTDWGIDLRISNATIEDAGDRTTAGLAGQAILRGILRRSMP